MQQHEMPLQTSQRLLPMDVQQMHVLPFARELHLQGLHHGETLQRLGVRYGSGRHGQPEQLRPLAASLRDPRRGFRRSQRARRVPSRSQQGQDAVSLLFRVEEGLRSQGSILQVVLRLVREAPR